MCTALPLLKRIKLKFRERFKVKTTVGKSDFVSSATMMASEYKSRGGYNTKGRRPDGSSETPRYLGEKGKGGDR
jgi:hypothetical protein